MTMIFPSTAILCSGRPVFPVYDCNRSNHVPVPNPNTGAMADYIAGQEFFEFYVGESAPDDRPAQHSTNGHAAHATAGR